MHRLIAALTLVLAVGCASQNQPRAFSVQVYEQTGQMRATSIEGQHAFVIRVRNISEEAVSVDEISLTPPTPVIEFHDADQIIERVLEPGETADFTMWIMVTGRQPSGMDSLDSLDVTLACHSTARGNFTEGGPHTVAVLR